MISRYIHSSLDRTPFRSQVLIGDESYIYFCLRRNELYWIYKDVCCISIQPTQKNLPIFQIKKIIFNKKCRNENNLYLKHAPHDQNLAMALISLISLAFYGLLCDFYWPLIGVMFNNRLRRSKSDSCRMYMTRCGFC